MSTNWKPGMNAMCVDDSPRWSWAGKRPVVKGNIYTVLAVWFCGCGEMRLDIGARDAMGTLCKCGHDVRDGVWRLGAFRFRPYEPLKEEMDRIEEAFVSAPAEVETFETVEV